VSGGSWVLKSALGVSRYVFELRFDVSIDGAVGVGQFAVAIRITASLIWSFG
jgi:hypothetical protein